MTISSEGCKNVKSPLVFFDKAKNGKIVLLAPIKCWDFEKEDGWLPYKTLISNILRAEKEFVNFGKMIKWMETGW
jgi:hypothetical protein